MFVATILRFINNVFNAYALVLIAYALMSWFPTARDSALGNVVNKLAQPYLQVFERFSIGPVGFSVVIGLLVLRLAQSGLNQIIYWLIF